MRFCSHMKRKGEESKVSSVWIDLEKHSSTTS
jgi:hypothetical protein